MATTSQKTKFIGEARDAITKFIDAWTVVSNMRKRGDDLGLLAAGANILTDPDFTTSGGQDQGIVAADFIAALTTADNAVNQTDRRTITKVRY